MDAVVNPPKQGDPSYDSWSGKVDSTLATDSAKLVADTLNSIQGITCNSVQGAMCAFPSISLSEMAMIAAKEAGQSACVLRLSPASGCWHLY